MHSEALTDHQLAVRARDGDAPALERLVERHYEAVFRLAFRWCGRRADAEDITQDVFVKLVGKLDRFHGQSSFRTWLYRIVVNTAKDSHRRRRTRRRIESAFAGEPSRGNPGPAVVDVLAARRLQSTLDRLPTGQKAAVLLVLGEGFTHKEAARALGCSETTVSWRIFQARRKVRKLWEAGA